MEGVPHLLAQCPSLSVRVRRLWGGKAFGDGQHHAQQGVQLECTLDAFAGSWQGLQYLQSTGEMAQGLMISIPPQRIFCRLPPIWRRPAVVPAVVKVHR